MHFNVFSDAFLICIGILFLYVKQDKCFYQNACDGKGTICM